MPVTAEQARVEVRRRAAVAELGRRGGFPDVAFPTVSDPDKPLAFVEDIVPPTGIPNIADPQDVFPLAPSEQKKVRPRWDEFVDATGRGIANVGSAAALAGAGLVKPKFRMIGFRKVPVTPVQKQAMQASADKLRKGSDFLWNLAQNPALAAQNTDLASKALNLIGETIPYITATTAAFVVAGPTGAFTVGSLVEGNSAYRVALDSGVNENKAKNIGIGVGVISGAIEAFGGKYAEKMLLATTKRLQSKIAKAGAVFGIGTLVEALEEGGQEIAQITGEETYRDVDWNERTTRVLSAMAGGGFLGGVMRGGSMAARGTLAGAAPTETPFEQRGKPGVEKRQQVIDFVKEVLGQEQYGALDEETKIEIGRKMLAEQGVEVTAEELVEIPPTEAIAAPEPTPTGRKAEIAPVTQPEAKVDKPIKQVGIFRASEADKKYNLNFVRQIQEAKDKDYLGTLGDFLKGEKIRELYKGALDTPIFALEKPIQEGKRVDLPENFVFAGMSGTFRGKLTIFVNPKHELFEYAIEDTILEEASHVLRAQKGRKVESPKLANLDFDKYREFLSEKTADKMVKFAKSLKEDSLTQPPAGAKVVFEGEQQPEAKAEEPPTPLTPKLYIGNVTQRTRRVFAAIWGVAPGDIKGYTEGGFPTKRAGIEVTREEAREALNILTEDLNRQFEENQIRTEEQLALANAHWGDIVQLREVLGLPQVARPFKVIRGEKRLMFEIPKVKERIEKAVQPSKLFDAGMTVQQVLQATMKKAEVSSAKGWLEGARGIVETHKDLARYAVEKLRDVPITAVERKRLLNFVATGRTSAQKVQAIAAIEMLAEKAGKRKAFIDLRSEIGKIKPRIGKTMQEGGIRPEYAKKLTTLIDSFRTTKITQWRLKDIGSLRSYLESLKEGIANDPTVDEEYRARLAESLVPEARLKQLDQLSKSQIHLIKAEDIRAITTELKRLVALNDVKNKIFLGRKARNAAEYLNRAVKEQVRVVNNSKVVKEQTSWTSKQKGGVLRAIWRYTGGLHNHDVKTLVYAIEGAKNGALYDVLVEGMREGRRIEAEFKTEIIGYMAAFQEKNNIVPSDLAKLSSAFQTVFRDPQQKVRKVFRVAVPTYNIAGTNWTMAELMLIYLHTKNDFSFRAMTNEGIASLIEEKGVLSAEDLAKVTKLVEGNRTAKLLTEMWEHIAENISKPAINGVSMDLKGIEIANVDNYTPVERRSPGKIAGNQEYQISLLESQGFLQERTGSKNPVIIRDFFAILNAHINGVAEYVGMAKPFRATHTILSYKPLIKAIDGKGREIHRRHINTLMERTESKPRVRGKIEAIFGKVLRGVPRAILTSPGIVVGQITSEISYGATDIPAKYLVFKNPMPSAKQIERMGKYFAWGWVRKHLGASSIETRNISSTDALLRAMTGKKALINIPVQGLSWMDMKAVTFGWLASERWVRDTTKLKGREFYDEVNKRAHKAISESQPMFEPENRSILTSSENVIARSLVMFRSYVDQTLRIFSRAHEGRINKTISRAKFAKMTGAVLAGFVAWKTLRILIDALLFGRKKDPYEVAKDVALSPLRALNLVGYQVEQQVSRMVDIWVGKKPSSRYWDAEFENLVLSSLNEVRSATNDFADAMAYYGTGEVYKTGKNKGRLKSDVLIEKAILGLTFSIGKIYGLPTPVIKKAVMFKKSDEKPVFH